MTQRQIATEEVLFKKIKKAFEEYDATKDDKLKQKLLDTVDVYRSYLTIWSYSKRLIYKIDKNIDIEIAEQMLLDFFRDEYCFGEDKNLGHISYDAYEPITYTELGDENQYPVQVFINLKELKLKYLLYRGENDQPTWLTEEEVTYKSLDDLMDNCLEGISFDDLIGPFYPYVDELEKKEKGEN